MSQKGKLTLNEAHREFAKITNRQVWTLLKKKAVLNLKWTQT